MTRDDVQAEIERKFELSKDAVLNKNAISALFGIVGDPVGSLGQLFLGRSDALDEEKRNLGQEMVLDLICDISESLAKLESKATESGVMNIVDGVIHVQAKDSDEVIGADIGGSKATELRAGTHIKVETKNVRKSTGLKIGS